MQCRSYAVVLSRLLNILVKNHARKLVYQVFNIDRLRGGFQVYKSMSSLPNILSVLSM